MLFTFCIKLKYDVTSGSSSYFLENLYIVFEFILSHLSCQLQLVVASFVDCDHTGSGSQVSLGKICDVYQSMEIRIPIIKVKCSIIVECPDKNHLCKSLFSHWSQ